MCLVTTMTLSLCCPPGEGFLPLLPSKRGPRDPKYVYSYRVYVVSFVVDIIKCTHTHTHTLRRIHYKRSVQR